MSADRTPVIPLHVNPEFQARHRVEELKVTLMAESLAFVQLVLDNTCRANGASPQASKILARACVLLEEARDQLIHELL